MSEERAFKKVLEHSLSKVIPQMENAVEKVEDMTGRRLAEIKFRWNRDGSATVEYCKMFREEIDE